MTVAEIHLLVSVLALAGLLFVPVSRIVWVLSVRRLQRKLARPLDPGESARQRRRAHVIAFLIVLVFSYLFNVHLLRSLYG